MPPLPARTCARCLKAPAEYRQHVYEAIAKDREGRRKEKERKESHERWLKERIPSRTDSHHRPDNVNLVKILRDKSNNEVKYSVIQVNDNSDTILLFGNQVIACIPPRTTGTWQHLMKVYREHKNSLGVTYSDVTGWVLPSQVEMKRGRTP